MNPAALLHALYQSDHLSPAGPQTDIRSEQAALMRLQSLRHPTFLQEYDLLFRWLSLWLLGQNYKLTNHQPHQVLARVGSLFCAPTEVCELVRCRHALKYEKQHPTATGREILVVLLKRFSFETANMKEGKNA